MYAYSAGILEYIYQNDMHIPLIYLKVRLQVIVNTLKQKKPYKNGHLAIITEKS